jgi:hypothetical protein
MTTEAASAVMVPSRPAWRSLLWFAPLTALWILLIYRWPAIPAGGIPTTAHQLAAHGLIALGLWLGLSVAIRWCNYSEIAPSDSRILASL